MNDHRQKSARAERPIGYWIKAADKALEQGIDDLHRDTGFGRRGWQVLNSIAQSEPVARERLAESVAALFDEAALRTVLDALLERALVSETPDGLRLTDAGKDLHHRLEQRQRGFRARAMQGISEDAYAQTVATLEAIVKNLA